MKGFWASLSLRVRVYRLKGGHLEVSTLLRQGPLSQKPLDWDRS